MAAPKKKRAVDEGMEITAPDESGSSDYEEDLDGEDQDEEMVQEQVEIDFEARNFEDSDFHGIRKLIQQLFLKANINLSEMTDTLISQNYIGSAIKQIAPEEMEDDDDDSDDSMDVLGAISIINLTERKDLEFVQQMKTTLVNHCETCAAARKDEMVTMLNKDDHQVGYIISERFINIPAQIAVPSFDSLWKEMERACRKNMKYKFDTYLLISKTCRLPQPGGKKKKGKAGKKQNDAPDQLIFVNPEEEIFHQNCAWSFTYSVKGEHDTVVGGQWDDEEGEMEPTRTVLFIPATNMAQIMAKMRELYSMAAT